MLYIATHKKTGLPPMPGTAIVQAGAAGREPLPYLSDATGDNISSKNAYFCELTVLYWVWKNTDDDFKGLAHYRRLFGRSNLSGSLSSSYTEPELEALLAGADIVLPYTEYLLQDARAELCNGCCRPDVYARMREVVAEVSPDYLQSFDSVFDSNELTLFNMMFCRRELFDSYCKWLFAVLFTLEKDVDMTGYSPYERRLYGFLSERLLNVWVRHNNLVVVHTAVTQTEMPLLERLSLVRRRLTNRIRFWLRAKASGR